MSGRPRLSARTLHLAQAADLPGYDRSQPPSIAHLGVGAFARAHLGVYADRLLRRGWPATVRGVSLRSGHAEAQLGPQDGLYTVTEREPAQEAPPRVFGAITSVHTGASAAIAAIAASSTRLVTLTVTEKGYELDPAEHPANRDQDMEAPAVPPSAPPMPLSATPTPLSAPAVIASGLARRYADERGGARPPSLVVASLDNVIDNGAVLREMVLGVASSLDPALAGLIANEVRFPCSVVDRIVPATTAADLDEVACRLGLVDLAAAITERHCSWVIENEEGLPPLADVGVEVVSDTGPFQQRKLWLLNAPHSALAYCGLLGGRDTIAASARDPVISTFVRQMVNETLAVAQLPGGLAAETFAAEAARRLANPSLGHSCVQVGADGSRKIPQRILPIVLARQRRRLPTERFAVVVATWIAAAASIPVRGKKLPAVEDPAAPSLRSAFRNGDLHHLCDAAVGAASDQEFVGLVAATLRRLILDGPAILVGLT